MSDELEEQAKRLVGRRAVDAFVRPNWCIGLGTGSTAFYAIERVGELVREGLAVSAVATSLSTGALCRELRIPLVAFGAAPIELAIDGADEIAPDWSLIKGGGGALFREKTVALVAERFVVVVTPPKLVSVLGAFPLPVEVVPFAEPYVVREISGLYPNVEVVRRGGDVPFVTDNKNWILDCHFGRIDEPVTLDAALRAIHGVVATGIFASLADVVLVGDENGEVRALPKTL